LNEYPPIAERTPSQLLRPTFEAETRISGAEAYVMGSLAVILVVVGTWAAINLGALHPVQLMLHIPALLLFALAINFYRRRGELTFRVVGNENCFVMMRKEEDVTIQFRELTKVVSWRDDSEVVTMFHLTSGGVERLGLELAEHGPLLAYIRGAFSGEMTYDGKSIRTPEEVPQPFGKRSKSGDPPSAASLEEGAAGDGTIQSSIEPAVSRRSAAGLGVPVDKRAKHPRLGRRA